MKKLEKKVVLEKVKEALRWVVFIVLGWAITETLKQIGLVPEFATLKVWVFEYNIPVRMLLQSGLTVAGRSLDVWLHVKKVETPLDMKFIK